MDGLGGYDWAAWVGLAVLLGVVEVTTLDLTFAMLAAGALAGAATGLVIDNLVVQALVALLVAIAMLAVVRPVALRHLRTPLAIRTGTAALVGERGLAIAAVDGQGGQIKLKGEVWSARTYDPATVIEAGRNVEVVQIDGATALVYESES
ncbi:MAG: NfeD family protein [Spirochaetaceae bacterium]|nr:NfeD family protein [Spirochaetaceae bacterium]